jgi:hypothetical protein
VLRIVTLFGCCRFLIAPSTSGRSRFAGGLNRIDRAFCYAALVKALAFTLSYRETAAAINQVAFLLDTIGGYFLLRWLIQDVEDIRRMLKVLVAISIIVAIAMTAEHVGMENPFRLIGGQVSTAVREGKIRAQGPFAGPIFAGVFGATLLPMWIWGLRTRQAILANLCGVAASLVIVFTSASSTPVLASLAAIGGSFLFPLRNRMRTIRWGVVCTIICLALVMKAPVWFLIARVDVIGGSSGYHRANWLTSA